MSLKSAQVAWLRSYWASVEPHMQGFYTNDVIDETQQQIDENYLVNLSGPLCEQEAAQIVAILAPLIKAFLAEPAK